MEKDAKILTGFNNVNGKWYYLNRVAGNNYGVMYANVTALVNGHYYAFETSGEMVTNKWFGGFYYGADGKRA